MSAKIWGDYEVHLDQTLGKGGMGAVYRGRQISVDRPVAIKVLKRDLTSSPDFVGRFQREATLLAKLVDTHIVQIFGAGEAEGQHFYAMEFVEGEDLASRLRRGHQFSPDEILHITIGTGNALDAAWKQKIIHRDIKPSNIIVAETDQVVKVMDFGLAKNPENDLTQTEMIMGTAKYMSPEQATGGVCDIRSDLYALGAVMYELGTGTAPFVGESATAVIYQHVHKEPVPPQKLNPSLPQSMQGVILRLLSKSPDDRYQEPIELVKDCQAILEGVTPDEKTILYGEIGKTPPSTVEPASAGEKTSTVSVSSGGGKGKWIGLFLAVFLLGGAGVWFGPQILSAIMGKGDQVELALTEAKQAASSGEWDRAVQKYTEALRYLPDGDKRRKEVETLRDSAGYQSTMSMAERSKGTGDLQAALEKYAEALKWLPDGDARSGKVQRLILDTRIELVEKFTIQRKWSQVIQECDELQVSLSEEDSRRSKVSSLLNRARGERALVKADEGFEDQKWPVAIQEYAAARQLLPEDHPRWKSLPGRISISEYEVHIGAASRETDLDQRIILLEQASKVSGLKKDRRNNAVKLLRRARVTRALDQASKLEIVKDWSGVGKALHEAAQFEDSNAKADEYRSKGGFYVELGSLVHLMANRKWKEASKQVQALLSTSAHYGNTDELSRREEVIQENLARLVEEEKTRLRTEFLLLVGDAIQEYEKGAWEVAKEKIDAAGQAPYKPYWGVAKTEFKEAFSELELRIKRAGSPPAGMVYVPSRKYQVGKDGAGVSGPAYSVALKEFYIDEQEVSVSSYKKFLDGVSALGSTWKCVLECPCGSDFKKHLPYKWEEQLNTPASSVKGTNWWDASAYMKWHSKDVGQVVRLPTEQEMEVASSWDLSKNEKRIYPWGNKFGRGKGESFLHLSGLDNRLLEWTSSPWAPYAGYEGNFPRAGKGDYVLRGGYKLDPKTDLQTWVRRGDRRRQQGRNYGFRCVRAIE